MIESRPTVSRSPSTARITSHEAFGWISGRSESRFPSLRVAKNCLMNSQQRPSASSISLILNERYNQQIWGNESRA